jgi:hypothetical protein
MMLMLLAWLLPAHAETPDEIVARAREAHQVDSAIQRIKLTVISKSGSERVREVLLRSRREGEVQKTRLEVTSPSDVAGFRVLTLDHATGNDERMVYMSSAKKLMYIDSKNQKSTRFIDSDLTMEDLQLRDSADGQRTLVEDTADHWVIDTAMGPESSYTKVRATITKADLVLKKLELHDATGLAKTIEVLRTTKVGEEVLPAETLVTDMRRGTKTKLEITEHQLNVGKDVLPDDTFTKANLER